MKLTMQEIFNKARSGYLTSEFKPGLALSFKSPFAGGIVIDELSYWWVDEGGSNRSAPFIPSLSIMGISDWRYSESPPEFIPTLFVTRQWAAVSA